MEISRRELLTTLALGVSTLRAGDTFFAQTPQSPRRLDLHHHFASPRLQKRYVEIKRQGWETWETYSPAKAVEAMDAAGVATSFLSLTTPGIFFGDDFDRERSEVIALARDMNEYAAKVVSDYKGRFGHFAVLPLPDVDASLREIEYAFDTLKADGVGLMTSNGNAWLGDKQFQPVFDELNRRGAIVYSHPNDAPCCRNLQPNVGPGTIEWNTDTSRALFSIIAENGQGPGTPSAATRYDKITWIWSHGGGTLLGLVGRFGVGNPDELASPPPNSRLFHLRRFYYDTAQSANPVTMQGLKTLVGASQIVYGTDYPFGGASGPATIVRSLQRCGLTSDELRGVDRENALRVLPKYRSM